MTTLRREDTHLKELNLELTTQSHTGEDKLVKSKRRNRSKWEKQTGEKAGSTCCLIIQ